MVRAFPWWNEKQKRLAEEAKAFAEENIPKGEEIAWTKKYPTEMLKEVASKGWFGAFIPEEYGGMGAGVTGVSIIAEELSRVCSALACAYAVTMFGGVEQLVMHGNNEQKEKWLPKMARGELLGAVCITEPFVGSDAAGIETTARREGDEYVLNGKKRFISNAGAADIYCVYAKTSDQPEDRARYRHLSAFIVTKGTSGFSVERINELPGWLGLPNGVLDFNEVRIPAENRIGEEGDGWKIMMDGLNFERVLFSAGMLGPMREALRYVINYTQRRVQFGQRTIDMPTNQFKIADMITDYTTSRLLVYYAAYLMDSGVVPMVEAAIAKLFASEASERVLSQAIQVMGGDGWTRFYPIESFFRDTKVNQIGAGTSEVMRIVIFRGWTRAMAKELTMPIRIKHEKLKIPISIIHPLAKAAATEDGVLQILAEDYFANPGLYMTLDDIKKRLTETTDEQLIQILTTLEQKGLVKIFKDRKGRISMVKATYNGLRKAKPLDYYKLIPEWVSKEHIF